MAEYISKAKLLEQISKDSDRIGAGQYGDEWLFADTIENMPTIDIVHCSECIHAEELMTGKWCCDISSLCQRGTFFCAEGKRK